MSDNIYSEIKSFIKQLGKSGYAKYMNILDDDIKYSSTSGEIMMKVNYHLGELTRDKTMDPSLINKASEIQLKIKKYIS